jgi:hypothetical protein
VEIVKHPPEQSNKIAMSPLSKKAAKNPEFSKPLNSMSKKMSKKISKRGSQNMSKKISEKMSKQMSKKMSTTSKKPTEPFQTEIPAGKTKNQLARNPRFRSCPHLMPRTLPWWRINTRPLQRTKNTMTLKCWGSSLKVTRCKSFQNIT